MKFSAFIEIIKQVLDSLLANKLRSILSALGVVIGISFVILMGWALATLDLAFEKTLNIIGSDMIYVDKFDWSGGKSWKLIRQRKNITLKHANELISRLKSAELAIPVLRKWTGNVKYKNENFSGLITTGTTYDYSLTPAGTIEEGRFYSIFEDMYTKNVAVLGYKVAQTMFPGGDAIGQTIKLNDYKFEVIGIVEKKGVLFIDFIDNQIFIPLRTFISIYGDLNRSVEIAIKSPSIEELENVRSETIGLMRELRNLKPYQEDDFSINETQMFRSSIDKIATYIWSIGIGMTALSFIVGIIGIMNIMFVSVTERTKEIGIRKTVGAKKVNILIQFIIEATTLCLIGAFVAFLLCSIIIFFGAIIIENSIPSLDFVPLFLPLRLFAISTVLAFIVGILAGIVPAIRAANFDPVDALRYEN